MSLVRSGPADPKGADKVHVLSDQEKLIVQKAKAIESKHKFKVRCNSLETCSRWVHRRF